MIWLHSPRKMMSALMSKAKPNPKHDPATRSLTTSDPCSVATRGLSKLLMNGGNAQTNTNKPKKMLALRFRAARCSPSVRLGASGTPPSYRAYQYFRQS